MTGAIGPTRLRLGSPRDRKLEERAQRLLEERGSKAGWLEDDSGAVSGMKGGEADGTVLAFD